ncbi:MFS transporter [Homoserinibacter sp. GY 40078]|uniref:MFS transporter n=1 Tax=Homoserinibacter sp. GY 40078 TaxID=2603275 RepID=UPI0021040A09|nr:MFS transporter [Homoserinibacter sp. GY 40078]
MSPSPAPEYAPLTEPIPTFDRRPTWRESFGALAVHNYRLYLASLALGSTGGWMARVAIDWLVLELTGDVALVGLAVAFQFAPVLLLGVWAGVLSDRLPRRWVMFATQLLSTLTTGVLAVLVLTGVVVAWQVLLSAAITGVAIAIEGPSRSAFVSEMVGIHRLRGAISLNATTFHLGGLLGPAISGALIAVVGSGWSIAINSVTTAVAALALVLMRGHELVHAPRQPRSRGQIREALRYVGRKPAIVWSLILLGTVAVFGMNLPVLLTSAADQVYGTGAAGYGLYSSLCALGAFVGAFLSSRRRTLRLRDVVMFAGLYGSVTAFAAWDGWYPLFLSALVGIGVTRLLFAMSAEALTQLSTNPAIRGRVVSLYIMVLMGGQALGGVVMGAIAENLGGRWAFFIAGSVPALAALVVAIVLAHRRELRIRVDLSTPRRMLRIVRREALG